MRNGRANGACYIAILGKGRCNGAQNCFFLVKWIIFAKIVGRDRVRVAPRYSNWAWSFKGGTVRQERARMRQDASG